MKMNIFQKNGLSDFERISVEVVKIREKSIIIQRDNREVELTWESEYTYPELCYGDVLLLYVLNDDFQKAYVLPLVGNLSSMNIGEAEIFRSELDKIREKYRKDTEIRTLILKQIISFLSQHTLDNLDLIKELTNKPEDLQQNVQELRAFFNITTEET
jgi:vacuolar-type H+-ATPase subunit I/STV1